MKTLSLLFTALLLAPGGDREKGLRLYHEGRFQEAAAAFEAAIVSEGDSAELQYNLALARWRAGDLANAETAVEKYVAMAGDARTDLHAGVLGAVRYDEAKALEAKADAMGAGGAGPLQPPGQPPAQPAEPADPLPVLEAALQKATQAKDYFVRGAVAATSPELQRNTERTLRYIDELQKKIDELKKQREEQKKDDDKKDEKKDDKDQKDDKDKDKDKDEKKDEKQDEKKDPQKSDEKKPDEKPKEGEGEQKPEPKPDEQPSEPKKPDQQQPQPGKPDEKQDEPKPGEQKPEAKPEEQKPRHDAPGEVEEGKELSPEQAQRLQDQLQKLDEQLKAFRARAKSGRKPVERDW